MLAPITRAVTLAILAVCLVALAGCGGGDSEPEVVTETVTVTDEGFTETTSTDPTFTDPTSTDTVPADTVPTNATEPVGVGETAVWNGDEFVVSDVETSDTEPVGDLLGEKEEAENGVWLIFKITPADDDSGIWSFTFHEEAQVRGGDGVVYLRRPVLERPDRELHGRGGLPHVGRHSRGGREWCHPRDR